MTVGINMVEESSRCRLWSHPVVLRATGRCLRQDGCDSSVDVMLLGVCGAIATTWASQESDRCWSPGTTVCATAASISKRWRSAAPVAGASARDV